MTSLAGSLFGFAGNDLFICLVLVQGPAPAAGRAKSPMWPAGNLGAGRAGVCWEHLGGHAGRWAQPSARACGTGTVGLMCWTEP